MHFACLLVARGCQAQPRTIALNVVIYTASDVVVMAVVVPVLVALVGTRAREPILLLMYS